MQDGAWSVQSIIRSLIVCCRAVKDFASGASSSPVLDVCPRIDRGFFKVVY